MVSRIEAKVEGLPIPLVSRFFTREASVNRAGGLVVWDWDSSSVQVNKSPSAKAGRILSLLARSASGLSRPST